MRIYWYFTFFVGGTSYKYTFIIFLFAEEAATKMLLFIIILYAEEPATKILLFIIILFAEGPATKNDAKAYLYFNRRESQLSLMGEGHQSPVLSDELFLNALGSRRTSYAATTDRRFSHIDTRRPSSLKVFLPIYLHEMKTELSFATNSNFLISIS